MGRVGPDPLHPLDALEAGDFQVLGRGPQGQEDDGGLAPGDSPHAAVLEDIPEAGPQPLTEPVHVGVHLPLGDHAQAGVPGRRAEGVGVVRARVRDPPERVPLRVIVSEPEHLHVLPLPRDGAARVAAGHDLPQRREVGCHPQAFLGPARGVPEPRHHLVEDEQHPVLPGHPPQLPQVAPARRYEAHGAPSRLQDQAGHVSALHSLLHGPDVVRRHHLHGLHGPPWDAGAPGPVEGRAVADGHVVVPAVEVAGEPHDLLSAGVRPGYPQGHKGRLGPGAGELHQAAPRRGHQPRDLLRPLDLQLLAGAVVGPLPHLLQHRPGDRGVEVAQKERPVAHPVVHVLVPVHVPLPRPLRPDAVYGEGPHVPAVVGHAPWEDPQGPPVEPLGAGVLPDVLSLDTARFRGL